MEIGNEISQKIRSAIKAKLVDLGVYVDDELPDYIMVMVANKKTQEQMTEDLNLFLSNNTEKFTSWLHGLLKKLQSITAEPKPTEETAHVVPKVEEIHEDMEEEELLIRPEHDDFEEESRGEPSNVTTQPSKPAFSFAPETHSVTPSAMEPTRTRSEVRPSLSSRLGDAGSSSRRALSPRRDLKNRLGSSHSLRSQSSTETPLQKQRAAIRKRRAPESVVGSVVHHEVVEEEYDPRRPLIGRVASTVRVGQRRPTVPPGQQANKSLLLKAMTEARDSIEKATQKLTEQVAYEAAEEVSRPVTRGRYGPRSRSDARGSLRSSGSSQPVTRVTSLELESPDDERSVQLYSRSKREEVLQQLRAGLHSDSEDISDLDNSAYMVSEDNRQVSAAMTDTPSPPPAAQYPGEEREHRTITINPKKDEQQEGEHMDMLVESGAEESDFTDEEGEMRIVQKPTQAEVVKERSASPKFVVTLDGVDPASMGRSATEEDLDEDLPKTVVRVAPQRVLTSTPEVGAEYAELDYMDMSVGSSPPKRSRLPEKCKFWMNCRNGDQCPYHHPSVPCKTFPKCKFGDKCLYIHPNCKYDATCTRADCPFSHRAKRTTPFTTPTAVPVVIQPFKVMTSEQIPSHYGGGAHAGLTPHNPAKQITCKFFPKCTNMSCPYIHPKPCRYGIGCNDKINCAFSHPDPPSIDKLKWTAPALTGEDMECDITQDSSDRREVELATESESESDFSVL